MTLNVTIEEQARSLAADNREAEPGIEKVYWFPHSEEIRLVSLFSNMPASGDGELHPFYFHPSPADGIFAPSRVALIRPEEFGKLGLPPDWGNWDDAVPI